MEDEPRAFLERWTDDNISKGRDAYIDALVAECDHDAEEGGFEAADIDEVAAEATDGEPSVFYRNRA